MALLAIAMTACVPVVVQPRAGPPPPMVGPAAPPPPAPRTCVTLTGQVRVLDGLPAPGHPAYTCGARHGHRACGPAAPGEPRRVCSMAGWCGQTRQHHRTMQAAYTCR